MFWPGYLPDEFEYLRVVDYLVGGERGGGGGGRGKEQQKTPLLFNFQTTSKYFLAGLAQSQKKSHRVLSKPCIYCAVPGGYYRKIFWQYVITEYNIIRFSP